ncbi:hypothetical protein GCM10027062_38200 [Nocardioides hungaricus]
MTDQDTIELRRMVETDPAHAGPPDLPALIRSGRRVRNRRRVVGGGVALGAAAVVTVPLLILTGGPGVTPVADDMAPASAPTSTSVSPRTAGSRCGVLSCVDPPSSVVETGALLDELSVDTLPDGAEEILYVARAQGAGAWAGQRIEVLSAGYRADGKVYRTAWALQPETSDPGAPRFWASPGLVNGRPGDSDHYVVLGFVDGSPERITWSTPDGGSGEVDGMLRLDGYTAFYLTQPMPADYVPPRVTKNKDGSVTVETDEGPRTVRSGDETSIEDLMAGATEFSPELTIHTSDGWSCTLRECGSMG